MLSDVDKAKFIAFCKEKAKDYNEGNSHIVAFNGMVQEKRSTMKYRAAAYSLVLQDLQETQATTPQEVKNGPAT